MTAPTQIGAGASSAELTSAWCSTDWTAIEKRVKRLQMRIAKATREGRYGKVKALQWLMTHSHDAKILAVKRVVENRGGKTPGVDNILWKSPAQKMRAALSLQRKGYRAQPLRRIYIPKKDGRQRPLSIPTLKCRAMQSLHLLSFEPVVEMLADKNAYGFRPKRSTADAIAQCFRALARKSSPQFIFEGDIKACFDRISHSWLLENMIMDTVILKKWLSAGYIDQGTFYRMENGTPQGGIISPALLNVTLSGLERAVKSVVSKQYKINISIYADDFIITGASRTVLEQKVKPAVENFLKVRGLELSAEKTRITTLHEGFDFLGFNVRKYGDKLLIKPSRKSVQRFLENIRELIRKNCAASTAELIAQLNPRIRGWANYYRHGVAKSTYSYVDEQIFTAIWRWVKRRHPEKNTQWLKKKYFRSQGLRNWIFYAKRPVTDSSASPFLDLIRANHTLIKRHVKIRGDASPYDPAYREYFAKRALCQKITLRETGSDHWP